MTSASQLPGGTLASAIEFATAAVRHAPTDAHARTLLFELLCYTGEWERAAKQLDVLAQAGPEQDVAVSRYRKVLEGEAKRRAVFTEGALPGLPPKFPDFIGLHLESLSLLHSGRAEEARAALERAAETEPEIEAVIDGETAFGLRDADDRFGPILEVFTGSEYSWIPYEMIQSIEIAPPKDFRDLLYVPAMIHLHIGPLGEVFIPAVYPGSGHSAEDAVRLGKITNWSNAEAGLSIGFGQRLLAAGDRDFPVLDIRSVTFNASAENV